MIAAHLDQIEERRAPDMDATVRDLRERVEHMMKLIGELGEQLLD